MAGQGNPNPVKGDYKGKKSRQYWRDISVKKDYYTEQREIERTIARIKYGWGKKDE